MDHSDTAYSSAEVTVDGSYTHDLFVSLEAIAAPATFPRWRDWAEQAATAYSEPELRRLRHWFGARIWLGRSYHALVPLLPEPREPAQLVRALGELPLGDFLRIAVTSGIVDPDAPLEAEDLFALGRAPQAAREYVERRLRVSGQWRTQILRTLADPEGARSELTAVLRRHAESPAFHALIEETRDERQRAVEALRELVANGLQALQHQLARNIRITEFSPVVVAASIFLDGSVGTYYQEIARSLLDGIAYEPLIFLVGTRRALGETPTTKRAAGPPAEKSDPFERAASTFSLLADPSRLRLIALLAQRPHYGQELAAALGMSGATISHHIDLLLKVGAISIERRAHRTYYILRGETLADLLRGASATLLDALARGETAGAASTERTPGI